MSAPSFTSFPDLPSPVQPQPTNSKPSHKHHKKSKKSSKKAQEPVADALPIQSTTFYSDRKGDPLNVLYGSNHAGQIPKYTPVHRGKLILGLASSWRVFARRNNAIEIGRPTDRRKLPILTHNSTRSLLAAPPTRRVRFQPIRQSDAGGPEDTEFIRISSRRKRAHRDSEPSYRTIVPTNHNSDDEDQRSSGSEHSGHSDEENESSSDEDETDGGQYLTAHQESIRDLEQRLTRDPGDISAWLSLLSHTLTDVPFNSKNAARTRAEITLSVLARALAVEGVADSLVLRLKYLRAGEEVWHESKLRAEWEAAIKLGKTDLWMEWLEWRIRTAAGGLAALVSDAKRVMDALNEDDLGKVRVFWRMAVVYRDAGFTERSTAMFQAQAELTYFLPQRLHASSFDTQLSALEEFWDSECPRVGEANATGWSSWNPNQPDTEQSLSMNRSVNILDLDAYRQWSFNESASDRLFLLPTRSTDPAPLNDDEDDPYSTVLFSDIRPFLFSMHSREAKRHFRLAWLTSLGLPIPGLLGGSNRDDRWASSFWLNKSCCERIFPTKSVKRSMLTEIVGGVLVGKEKEYKNAFGPIRSWGTDVFDPLEGGLRGTEAHGMWEQSDIKDIDVELTRRVFAQLRQGDRDVEWVSLSLAFEVAASSAKSASKLSRTLLSTTRNSLPHWRMHARLERMRGRLDDARKVYQTALQAAGTDGSSELWWDWAEMEWLAGRTGDARKVILRAAGVDGEGGVTVLRAKRTLDDAAEGSQEEKVREAWVKLRMLLELLVSGDVQGTFDHHLEGGEGMTVASLLLLYRHTVVLKNPAPRAMLRTQVQRAFDRYPNNTILLGLFLEGEKGEGVWGRVRAILSEKDGQSKDVARRVADVWVAGWESGRWESEIERTRNGLAAAVEHERTSGSGLLWRLYLEFEIRVGDLQRGKKVLYRAIGECPLYKELYLQAFGGLRSVFNGHELSALMDTMIERGLRLRKVLEIVGANSDNESVASEDSEAKERRRLLPY